MEFFLGTHKPQWLSKTNVPLFLSIRVLRRRRTLPRAKGRWALDSGGFTELTLYGGWKTSPHKYVNEIRRFSERIGNLEWAAPQDWMCEPLMLEKTGLTVREHQLRTLDNYLLLRSIAPDLPIIPVLQGWVFSDYLNAIEDYRRAGIALADLPRVGLGSVCRRQDTTMVENLIRYLAGIRIRVHGFGFKLKGLAKVARFLTSADSIAWTVGAPHLPGHTHKRCSNCLEWALRWRTRVLELVERVTESQTPLF